MLKGKVDNKDNKIILIIVQTRINNNGINCNQIIENKKEKISIE